MVRNVRDRDLDGVVCGHIHAAAIREVDGVTYINCGDWVESCTALVEHHDGRLEILDGLAFNEMVRQARGLPADHRETEEWPEPVLALRNGNTAAQWKEIFAA